MPYYLFIFEITAYFQKQVRNMGYGGKTCLDSAARKGDLHKPVGLYPCHRMGGNQVCEQIECPIRIVSMLYVMFHVLVYILVGLCFVDRCILDRLGIIIIVINIYAINFLTSVVESISHKQASSFHCSSIYLL